jgi:transcription termination/antitermination protein NusG
MSVKVILDHPEEGDRAPVQDDTVVDTYHWYAVKVVSGQETSVMNAVRKLALKTSCDHFFKAICVPCDHITVLRNGKRVDIKRKHFPGYVFFFMDMQEEAWHLIRRIPKVQGFLGGRKPFKLSQKEADRMSRYADGLRVETYIPHDQFLTGDCVRVNSGPFTGFSGTVDHVVADKQKVIISLLVFGRSTPVQLDFSQIEKMA